MRRVWRRLAGEERGFTLAEMLVAILMMTMVFFALHSIFSMSLRVFTYGNSKVEAVEQARAGLERMEREIRAAQPDGSGQILYTHTSNTISFDHAGLNAPERVTYRLSAGGDQVIREAATSEPLVENVKTLKFEYFQSDGVTPATSEPDISIVRITLEVKPPGNNTGSQTLTTDVYLRNRE